MLELSTVEQFANALRGRLILPEDAAYDEARAVRNGMIDRRPAMIAQCRNAADVMAAVDFAREHRLPLSVKAGGYSVAGRDVCNEGLLVDLAAIDGVHVDPEAQTARVGAGATWGDFDHEAQAFGLATTGGVDSRASVADLALGGRFGYLARRFGLTADNVLAADVVTADGELRQASPDKNPELFWALRGGDNVGVVTSLAFQLHEVGPEVLVAQSFHPFAEAGDVLRCYRDVTAGAPRELTCYFVIAHVPAGPPFPNAFHGQMAAALVACYAGPFAEAEGALAPLEEFGNPFLKVLRPMLYTELQQRFDARVPEGKRYFSRSQPLDGLSDDAIDVIVSGADSLPGRFSMVGIEPMGGAIAAVDSAATPYAHRDAAYNFTVLGGWSDPDDDEAITGWTQQFHDAMKATVGGDDDGQTVYRSNYERMVQVKKAWDPDNVFCANPGLVRADKR